MMLVHLAVTAAAIAGVLVASAESATAQVEAPFQTKEERSVYGDDTGSGSILDATNPMELINRIRQSGSMQDATEPSDAVDEALKAYQQKPAAVPQAQQP